MNKDDKALCTHLCSSNSCNYRHLKQRQVFTHVSDSSSLFWAAKKHETATTGTPSEGHSSGMMIWAVVYGTHPGHPVLSSAISSCCICQWNVHELERTFTAMLLQPNMDPRGQPPLTPTSSGHPTHCNTDYVKKTLRKASAFLNTDNRSLP